MKNAMLKKLIALSMLLCVGIVAWAENVLYVHPVDPSNKDSQADAFSTKNFAFADEIDNSVSVAVWVKDVLRPNRSEERFIAGVQGSWKLRIYEGKLAFLTGSGSAQTNNYVVNDGNWHFLVGTFNYDSGNANNSFQRLYVDGVLVGELETAISALATPARAFSICAPASDMNYAWGAPSFFGHFAELSVWNRALSDSEISTLYTRRVGGNESGLVAYWPLTGTPGTTASADFSFANCAQTTGVPALTRNETGVSISSVLEIVADDGFAKPYVRYVASPEWCAEHSYEQKESATGRSWSDPLTNLVETAAAAKKFERILCSPGTHKIASAISPLVEYFYLGSYDPATGKPCPETAIIDAQQLCRHFLSNTTTGQSNFSVENLTFVNGSATGGGSMSFNQRVGKINNCIFHNNAATQYHGGAYAATTASGMIVSNCLFYGNTAAQGGGAVYANETQGAARYYQLFVDCVFTNNTITAGNGGAVEASMKVELENCLFDNNRGPASGSCGGHASLGKNSVVKGCEFTGVCRAEYGSCLGFIESSVVVSNCVVRGLAATGSRGVFTIYVSGLSNIQFVDCIITNNSYNALHLFRPNGINGLRVRQCLIAGNPSAIPVLPNQIGSSVFENCTIDQGTFNPESLSAAATNILVNCILQNATITSSGNYCNILSNSFVNAVQSGSPFDSGVITGDPKFVDAAHGDYTLEVKSPCREVGLMLDWMTNGSTDLLGNPRVVDTYGKAFSVGALPDLGCYEIQERSASGLMFFVR